MLSHFSADPFQRLTLKPKCFIHAITMKTYRLIAVLNITACERTFGMHHFTPPRFDQNATLPNCFESFSQSSGPRERWAGGTSWRKTRSKKPSSPPLREAGDGSEREGGAGGQRLIFQHKSRCEGLTGRGPGVGSVATEAVCKRLWSLARYMHAKWADSLCVGAGKTAKRTKRRYKIPSKMARVCSFFFNNDVEWKMGGDISFYGCY